MAPRPKIEEPVDPDECLHQGRPTVPRADTKPWHCEDCDTSFIVSSNTEHVWREL